MKDNKVVSSYGRRLVRFSLRSLLVIVTIICVWLGCWVHAARRQAETVAWVQSFGGRVGYKHDAKHVPAFTTMVPSKLRTLLGIDFFVPVVSVEFVESEVEDLTLLANLPKLESLDVFLTPTIKDVSPLAKLTHLRVLRLSGTQVKDLGPVSGLTGLEQLSLEQTNVTDLAALQSLTQLKVLNLDGTPIRDTAPLARLQNLETLTLSRTRITDVRGIEALTRLRFVGLRGTIIDDHKCQVLRKALPDCFVEGGPF